ncbi:hypothetical protein DICPUDRAFT_36559 [Dictyostelium purpureum]|uniref:Complex 1 LYR protein domain-containing protein n=1 Tax=Dictyostelium purpureum TaxID=5786 RepID=F0ZR91_DICPU|nr:uncharacterized protein DICPUDRAFT_36559 [Dictyostelium purpureum]EGC33545.1 hypothetical protein DICPUDRAFT_36559 [Dictyostelium purpureum]|eukprot:XP_003289927.1 hypothetical protein DICPUDRAFT_36559 [Dictyostelium purpureum]
MSSKIIKENKKLVLNLYKRCLYSAKRCPKFQNQLMMESYIKLKFRSNKDVHQRDFETIETLIKQGEEELKSMNEYHELRSKSKKGEDFESNFDDEFNYIGNKENK